MNGIAVSGGSKVAGVKGVVYAEAKKTRRCTKRKLTLFSGVTGGTSADSSNVTEGVGGVRRNKAVAALRINVSAASRLKLFNRV